MSSGLPNSQLLAGIAIIAVPVILLVRLIFVGTRQGRRDLRAQNGECTVCGYDLRESPAKCPECGSVPDPTERARAALNNLLLMPRGKRQLKEFKEGIRVCQIILQNSSDAEELNQAAWVLAAVKNPPFRDPPLALNLAQRACELTKFEKASCLDTLGVCYAACGQFDEAIRYVEMALERCARANRAECEKHLESFRDGEMYYE